MAKMPTRDNYGYENHYAAKVVTEKELSRHGVEVKTGIEVTGISSAGCLRVTGSDRFEKSADIVIVASGVRPSSELAGTAGVLTGIKNAIREDRSMRTNVPDIYAAGDCVETWHRVIQQYRYLPLGTTSHKQGRVAGRTRLEVVRALVDQWGPKL